MGQDKVRQSNFELLRIIAMFFVLIVHADFLALGVPSEALIHSHPFSSAMRFIIQSMALVCVNVYIFISGYFSIKLRWKSILSFLFMLLFWRGIILVAYLLSDQWGTGKNIDLGLPHITALLIPGQGDWFVQAYILLMVLSPVLNTYIDKSSDADLKIFLIIYWGIQLCFNWLSHIYPMFESGYSVMSFIGLYILGALLYRKKDAIKGYAFGYLLAYILLASGIGFVTFMLVGCDIPQYYKNAVLGLTNAYNGLFVMGCTVLIFIGFMKIKIHSRIINIIASSSFAVYLMHMHPLLRGWYLGICRQLFNNYGTWEYIGLISLFLIGLYAVVIIIDRLRNFFWELIIRHMHMRTSHPIH